MQHSDHVALLRDGVPGPGGAWADLGSGAGAFTLALADLVGPDAEISSVDTDRRALARQAEAMRAAFPATRVRYLVADFTGPLALPPLDGIVMANALHFQRDQAAVVRALRERLRPGGRLLLVEYNTDRGNRWVPYPLAYPTWAALAGACGFAATRLLHTRPSRFLGEIYSAVSVA
ncbi:MAG TPA: class I SAM-dependent methyltransferase [Thermomicrobiales bacterium]|nr:class I SAM-dependent methyltransferase [Thermomicrobiales bacterium]